MTEDVKGADDIAVELRAQFFRFDRQKRLEIAISHGRKSNVQPTGKSMRTRQRVLHCILIATVAGHGGDLCTDISGTDAFGHCLKRVFASSHQHETGSIARQSVGARLCNGTRRAGDESGATFQ